MHYCREGWIVEPGRHVVRSEDVSLRNETDGHVAHPLRLGGLRTEVARHASHHNEVAVLAYGDHRAYWVMEVVTFGFLSLEHHTLENPKDARPRRGKEGLDRSGEGHESAQLDQDAVRYQNAEEPWLSPWTTLFALLIDQRRGMARSPEAYRVVHAQPTRS